MAVKLFSIIGAAMLLARISFGQTWVVGLADDSEKGYSFDAMYPTLLNAKMPVANLHTSALTCRSLSINDKVTPFKVEAGSPVPLKFDEETISPMHNTKIKGPCTFWLADIKTKGKNASWFKIAQYTFDEGGWCTDHIQENGNTYALTIPEDIPSGTYYLRTEIIDLAANLKTRYRDFTRGPHFYVNCLAIAVEGTGEVSPKGHKIPGIYDNVEEKFVVNVEDSDASKEFVMPGPAVYNADTSEEPSESPSKDE
ncbi:hypothetical protein GGI00_000616 [Coemansia sp. RSA 2681]|nr:hypothetical protein GGI00_000616 [Coemansia sp. RSA 2681]